MKWEVRCPVGTGVLSRRDESDGLGFDRLAFHSRLAPGFFLYFDTLKSFSSSRTHLQLVLLNAQCQDAGGEDALFRERYE